MIINEIIVFLVIGALLATKIGIIGYKNHAERLRVLLEDKKDCEINYIFHPKKLIDDQRSTNELSDLYNCDAIIIASPNSTHFEYIKKLLSDYEGYIFCEKPPVTSLKDLNELERLSHKDKSRIFFNFNFRFSELSNSINKQLNSEQLGKITHINIISTQGLAFKKEYLGSWRADGKNNLHNILETVMIHYLDLLNYHLGKSEETIYIPHLISQHGDSFDTGYLLLKYPNQITASIFNSYAAPCIDEISIIGTNGFFTIRENRLKIYSPRDTFDSKGFFVQPPIIFEKNFDLGSDYQNSLKKSLDYFLLHVKEKRFFELNLFNSSLATNFLILELKNKAIID